MSDFKAPIGVIGAGTMGSSIAQLAAMNGHRVELFDSNGAQLERCLSRISESLLRATKRGQMTEAAATEVSKRIHFYSALEGLAPSKFVIEAIIESVEAKGEAFSSLERFVSNDCILATNTSSLSVTAIASACKVPGRVVGLHFFNPAHLMPLVEVVSGLLTNEDSVLKAKQLVQSWSKETILAKDTPGFLVNRIARPFYGEALRILEEQVVDVQTIDWAMRELGGFRMGPFELMDFIGLDINFSVTKNIYEQFFYASRFRPSLVQQRLLEAKRLGKKSGQGFYSYSDSAPAPRDLVPGQKENGAMIVRRILLVLANEAIAALQENVGSAADIDRAMITGMNFPQGPLAWCEGEGLENVLNQLLTLYESYGEDRYRPQRMLTAFVREGKNSFFTGAS